MPTIETECGKKIKQRIEFKHDGTDFSAHHAATKYLIENDFSYGSMQRDAPIGVVKGKGAYISKWRNLGEDKPTLDGALCSHDFRNKDVWLMLFID